MSNHHIQGAKAKASGLAFEERINAAFERYRAAGVAVIQKTPEPMKPIKSLGGGRFVAVYEKKAQPDYCGVHRGKMLVFEAKYTTGKRMRQSRVTANQAAYLDEYERHGAECYILAGFSSGMVYRVPWAVWWSMDVWCGRASVSEDDLSAYRVPLMGDVPLVLDGI